MRETPGNDSTVINSNFAAQRTEITWESEREKSDIVIYYQQIS